MKPLVNVLLWDLGLSILPYFLFRLAGCSETTSLIGGTAVASVRLAYVIIRHRRIDGLALFMIGLLVVGLALTAVTGDVRLLAAKDSLNTAFVGVAFLVTIPFGRPVMFLISRHFRAADPAAQRRWDELWVAEPGFRRMFYVGSTVWGAAMLAEAVLRIVLVYLWPIDLVIAVSTPAQLGG
ncbi:VC0807 family protein [Fodinicola feengrottensis]|uniref:VC0807 family protein n=1 Tax=Fodinicola feengrottensis TaxID=435914 RepID=UPI0013D07788|nr:VC0807 family protein [Fodinicola feengrottensis]